MSEEREIERSGFWKTQLSFQKETKRPLPICHLRPLRKLSLKDINLRHCQELLWGGLWSNKCVLCKYLLFTNLTHRLFDWVKIFQSSFIWRALLVASAFFMPRPPNFLGLQILSQPIRFVDFLSASLFFRNFL